MREPGIEPGASAWQAEILPLNHSHGIELHTFNLGKDAGKLNAIYTLQTPILTFHF